MNKKELEEKIEKYMLSCIDKSNETKKDEKCEKMWENLQKEMLPKSRKKKWLVWDLNPRIRIYQNLSLTP